MLYMNDIFKKIGIWLAILPMVYTTTLNAQDYSDDKERIARIEGVLSKLPKISGFVNLRYVYDNLNNNNSFDVRRARLDFRGDISEQFAYRLQIEFANNPKILDAYVNWKINSQLQLQTGQYKIPFSIENAYSPTNLEMIDNSLVIMALSNYSDVSGISANGRDVGLGFSGSFLRREGGFSIINYSLGLFNGSGINTPDNNKSKDFSGILTVNPLKYLSVAGYHYNGSAVIMGDNQERVRTGFGTKYDYNQWLLRGEYIIAETGDLKSEGAYAVLGYFVHPKIQTLVKYDYLKRDKSDSDIKQQNYTAGINYLPVKNIRLQLNYSYKTSFEYNYNYISTQLTGMF